MRAATWGRPYGNVGPLWSVGADLRVRPPLLGAHIGAPLRQRAGSFFVIARRAAGPTRRSGFPRDKADSHGPFGASE